MTQESRQLVQLVIRVLKFTASLLEKFLKGEQT